MLKFAAALVVLLAAAAPGAAHEGGDEQAVPRAGAVEDARGPAPAPGYSEIGYAVPEPGTYRLPPLGEAGDGEVVDSSGRAGRLHDLFGDKIVVLSFIYSSCSDVNGCPLATFVLKKTLEILREDPRLAGAVRLISLSFDPEHDSPEVMARYKSSVARSGDDWRFLTTPGRAALQPILDRYSQWTAPEVNSDGDATGGIAHLLRVFLIDRDRRIRNIYGVSFLHHRILLNDIRTVLMQDPVRRAAVEAGTTPGAAGPGDDRGGYESDGYETRARSLEARRGRAADLLANANRAHLGLPPLTVPKANPLTRDKIALGRRLFFDRRLSLNGTISCAMCHVPEQGFANRELATAVGIEGRSVRRNAPTLLNVALLGRLFHDGRETSLAQQVWSPLLATNEMGNRAVGQVLERVRELPGYARSFEQAFPDRGLTMETLGMALASYQRTLLAGNSPFDRWYYGDEEPAVPADARRGFKLFTGKAGCSACHRVDDDFALFTDEAMHNTGIGYRRSMQTTAAPRRLQVAPGRFVDLDRATAEASAPRPANDLGLYELTLDPADRWKFRTPSLRNVALTPPYMHDGSLSSLREVVEFYNKGGVQHPLLDPLIRPLGLSEQEVDELLAFLNALTGDSVEMLVADAFAAPVGNLQARPGPKTPARRQGTK